MQPIKYFMLLVTVGLLACWVLPSSSSKENPSRESVKDVVYVCRETKELIKAPPQKVPATNPSTGRATLYRALYCSECRRWHPVPPPELYSGNPLTYRCPKHHRQMTASGPLDQN